MQSLQSFDSVWFLVGFWHLLFFKLFCFLTQKQADIFHKHRGCNAPAEQVIRKQSLRQFRWFSSPIGWFLGSHCLICKVFFFPFQESHVQKNTPKGDVSKSVTKLRWCLFCWLKELGIKLMAWCLWQEVEIGERKRIKSPASSTRYTRQKQHMEHISEEGQGRVSGKRSLALLSHRFMHFKRIQEVIWRWCNHGIPPNCKHYWNPRRRHKKTMRFDHHSHATNHQIKVASWEMVGLPIFPATLPPLPPAASLGLLAGVAMLAAGLRPTLWSWGSDTKIPRKGMNGWLENSKHECVDVSTMKIGDLPACHVIFQPGFC